MNQPNKRLLVRDGEPLKMFMFTIQGGPAPINILEDFHSAIAYNQEEALQAIMSKYPKDTVCHWRSRGNFELQQLLDHVELPTKASPYADANAPEPPKSAEQFVASLMLVAETFVKEPIDLEIIKGILAKVKLHDPDKGKDKDAGKAGGSKESSTDSDGSSAGTKGAN